MLESADAPLLRDDSPAARPPLLRPKRTPPRTLDAFAARFGGVRVDVVERDAAVELTGLSSATPDLVAGDVFVAVTGDREHGARFWKQARDGGAAAIVTDAAGALLAGRAELPTVVVDDPRSQLASMSGWMYGTATGLPPLFGVTGTNGKTSTVYLLHAILSALGVRAGLSTTVERRIGETSVPSRLTTPESPEMHALLARMVEDGAQAVAVEVSAHGVRRSRVDGLRWDAVGFTNLSHDYLDEFGDMDDYLDAKAALFSPRHAERGIVSLDSDYGRRLADRATIPVQTISSDPGVTADWTVRILSETRSSTAFAVTTPDGSTLTTTVPLMGRHMAADAALAIAMLVSAGTTLAAIDRALAPRGIEVRVPGRSERVSGEHGPLVLVDFSHNGGAFETTLRAMRRVTAGSIIMVVGADGEKDASKREDMGYRSAANSDVLIITDHHPRNEDPLAIRLAVARGARRAGHRTRVHEIADPADAIRAAVALATPSDAILWAGPGCTDYRIVGDDRIPYSPRRDARNALREVGWL